jgi:hypothetical protein
MQAGPLLGEHIDGRALGLGVPAGVDSCHDREAGHFQCGEARVILQQVGLGRNQVGLGDLDGRLRAALGLWLSGS